MSVEALAIGLHHSRAKGVTKLVLLGIANHDGDGGSWPSLATLAKYGGCSVDNARKAVNRLVALGEVQRLTNEGGTFRTPDHMRPNLYVFKLRCPYDCDGTTNHRPRGVLFPVDNSPVDKTGDSPRAGGVPADGLGEPSTNHLQPVKEKTTVPKRARDANGWDHRNAAGNPCTAEMVDERHCAFGHTKEE